MKAKTELLLYQLLWLGNQLTRPTFHNLSASFESWAYSEGLLRVIHNLEEQQLIETQGKSQSRIFRLTLKGHQVITGDRDPEYEWSRKWDGIWRMVLFDIPESKRSLRRTLRKILHCHHFGCFQKSVWIYPHLDDPLNEIMREVTSELGDLTLMESRLLPGGDDSSVVENAWDFSKINKHYEAYIQHINSYRKHSSHKKLDHLLAEEKKLWDRALNQDPLLPKKLLPKVYLGRKAYQLRQQILPKIINSLLNKKDNPR